MSNSKGVLLYALHNDFIDYFKMAQLNATLVNHHLNVPVTLIADVDTRIQDTSMFDNIILTESDDSNNSRLLTDSTGAVQRIPFSNKQRFKAYQLSPYEETLLLDTDYLMFNSLYNNCWGTKYDLMINSTSQHINYNKESFPKYINHFGIKFYWATAVYFKKTPIVQSYFSLIEYVYNNYDYFRSLYDLGSNTYRNDFSFSIALHLMKESGDGCDFMSNLPGKTILSSYMGDELISYNKPNTLIFKAAADNKVETMGVAVKNSNIHIMDKTSLLRHADDMMEAHT